MNARPAYTTPKTPDDYEAELWSSVDRIAALWMDSLGDFLEVAELLQDAHAAKTQTAKREICNRIGSAMLNRSIEMVEWRAEQLAEGA